MTDLVIRPAVVGDAAAIAEIYAPYVTGTVITFEETPPTPDEMAQRISALGSRYDWLVAEDDGGVVGYAYSHAFAARPAYRWSCEVSIYVHPERRGAGVGRRLYADLLERTRRRGYRQALAGITVPNPASVGIHTTFGFTEVGRYRDVGWKAGAWHDVVWMQVSFAGEDPPREPLAD